MNWDRIFDWLGWTTVTIFIAFRKDGSVKALLPHGKERQAIDLTETPYYERAIVDMPEICPTRIWLREPPNVA